MNVGIFGLLGLIFVTLKLLGFIGWSWFWVLSPFWIPIAILTHLFILAAYYVWKKESDYRD